MAETPRQYKKRIDEKRKKNAENRDKLIQQIEKYELVDEDFKAKTKQEILDNFEKNLNADKDNELYLTVGKELEKIDVKYVELAKMKEQLKLKKQEKTEIEKEIKGSKLDGKDETTLRLQMAEIKKLNKRFETIKLEIEELEKNIKDRESELKDIEETYGEKTISSSTNAHSAESDEDLSGNAQDSSGQGDVQGKPSTLKEYRKQTLQDLWNKDRTRGKIFEILEDGTGIDAELKDKIEKEISDRFFDLYDEKQGSLKMKTARYLKNKIRNGRRDKRLVDMAQGPENEKEMDNIERGEKLYGEEVGMTRELVKIKKKLGVDTFDEVKNCGVIGGEPCFTVKNSDGYYRVIWGDDWCGDGYKEIGEIKDIGGKPCFKVKDRDGDYCVYWGYWHSGGYKEIGEIKDIGGKPCFTVKNGEGDCRLYWGKWHSGGYKEIGEIKDIGGKPCFRGRASDGDYRLYWGDWHSGRYGEIGEIKDVGGEPCFRWRENGYYRVIWGDCRRRSDGHVEIYEIKDIGGKPCFKVKNRDGTYRVYWGKWHIDRRNEIGEIKDIGGKPCFKAKKSDGTYRVYWGDWCGDGYKEIGEIKEIGGRPCFKVKKFGVWYRKYVI